MIRSLVQYPASTTARPNSVPVLDSEGLLTKFTNKLKSVKFVDFASEYDNGTVTENTEIDWSNGSKQVVTLGADVTLSFANTNVGHRQLRVVQDGTGGRTVSIPSGKWPSGTAGVFSTDAYAEVILSIFSNGTDLYYQIMNAFSVPS